MKTKFYICEKCGNIIGKIHDSGVTPVCCGQKMTPLVAGAVDASLEKHVPVVTVEDNEVRVNVGSVDHPMSPEHYIVWVYLETDKGGQRKTLSPTDKPEVIFALKDEKPLSVYAYCNLHGLWKADV